MLIISLVACFSVYQVFVMMSFHPWVEIFLGGMISVLIYFVGFITLKVLTKQDYQYLRRISDSFGPFAPIIRWLIDFLIRLS